MQDYVEISETQQCLYKPGEPYQGDLKNNNKYPSMQFPIKYQHCKDLSDYN